MSAPAVDVPVVESGDARPTAADAGSERVVEPPVVPPAAREDERLPEAPGADPVDAAPGEPVSPQNSIAATDSVQSPSTEPAPIADPAAAPEADSPSTAVPLRRAMQRHDEAMRRVRSEAAAFRQLADDESVAPMANALVRLQGGVHELNIATRELAGAAAHECDAVAKQIDAVPAPDDRARMHRSLTQLRAAFERSRSERQRGLSLLDELRGEVLSYARRRADLSARLAEAAAVHDALVRTAAEFGAARVLAEANLTEAPADDASMQELEDRLAQARAVAQR